MGSLGLKTLHIGIIDDDPGTPERFFCASESARRRSDSVTDLVRGVRLGRACSKQGWPSG
jgi:hypothetical protein